MSRSAAPALRTSAPPGVSGPKGPTLVRAGAARSGTTRLAARLARHPGDRQPVHQGAESISASRGLDRGYDWYAGLFPRTDGVWLDASAQYTFPEAIPVRSSVPRSSHPGDAGGLPRPRPGRPGVLALLPRGALHGPARERVLRCGAAPLCRTSPEPSDYAAGAGRAARGGASGKRLRWCSRSR